MKIKFIRRLVIILQLLFFFTACSGPKSLQNSPDIDSSWQGTWSGPALVEKSTIAAKKFELDIVFTSTHIIGYFTDEKAGIRRKVVTDLKIHDDELQFKVPYQTKYVLRSYMKFTGKRKGRSMTVTFSGREGGWEFSGKWQARKKMR